MTKARHALLIASGSLLALTGCLSIESIKTREPELDAGDGDVGDGDVGDGDDLGPDAGPDDACVDRGTAKLDSLTFRDLSDACPAGTVCDAGHCIPEPACAPGVTTACQFAMNSPHGAISGVLAFQDHFYWLESGSFDALSNYQYDGAIVRTRVGTWGREEIATGLSLVKDSDATKLDYVGFFGENGWFYTSRNFKDVRLVSKDGSASYQLPVAKAAYVACIAPDGTLVSGNNGNAMPYTYEPATGRTSQLSLELRTCVVDDKELWIGSDRIYRMPLDTRVLTEYAGSTVQRILAHREQVLFAKNGAYVANATLEADTTMLRWTNVVRVDPGNHHYATQVTVHGDHVYWTTSNSGVILRADLSGSGTVDAVADASSIDTDPDFAVTDAGVAWWSVGQKALHFVPTPAP